MNRIMKISLTNVSREEQQELRDFLELNHWEFSEELENDNN